MKIVLTGATGFLGSEVLDQCCQSTDIDSIVVLTRKPLQQDRMSSKVRNMVVQDFRHYSAAVIGAISDADACIWLVS